MPEAVGVGTRVEGGHIATPRGRVRAVVRSAADQGSDERLSYAVGAESLQGEIEAPWILRDTSEGGPLFNSPAIYTAPEDDSLADTSDEEYAKLTPYGQNQVVAARAARSASEISASRALPSSAAAVDSATPAAQTRSLAASPTARSAANTWTDV